MASQYKSYREVEKVQRFLNDELAKGVITGEPLKVDGKWGPKTTAAFSAWSAAQGASESGAPGNLAALVEAGVLTEAEVAVVAQAWDEHNRIVAAKTASSGAAGEAPPSVLSPPVAEKKGWSTTTWLLIGAGVVGAGLLAWWWARSRKTAAAAPAMLGLDDLGEPGDLGELGEGSMVSLAGRGGRKSLGCGCGK